MKYSKLFVPAAVAIVVLALIFALPSLLFDYHRPNPHRGIEAYVTNVYKAMMAYNAETRKVPPTGDCMAGYFAGQYSAASPSGYPLKSCRVEWLIGLKEGSVRAVATDGFQVSYPEK